MHDYAQATLMFGLIGLPFSAFLLGSIMGVLLQATLIRSPNIYFSTSTLILFAAFVPTRGYLAQQTTWALTFLAPLMALHFASRFVLHRKRKDFT